MRILICVLGVLLVAACTTPKTEAEAKAQKCRSQQAECERRIRGCQDRANDLTCKDAEVYCKASKAGCGN